MATFKATANVYVDERYIRAGETFTTTAPKGDTWTALDPLDHDGNGRKGGRKPAAED